MIKQWKNIYGYGGQYKISNIGEVATFGRNKKGQIRKNQLGKYYYHLTLWKNDKQKNHDIHRLVALAFIPNPENKPQVNHIDSNKLNNSVFNLEWVTQSENLCHASNNNKAFRGVLNHKAILNESQVISIRKEYMAFNFNYLASKYGVDRSTIQHIVYKTTWRHLL